MISLKRKGILCNYPNHTLSFLSLITNETKSSEYADKENGLTLRTMSYCSRFETCPAPKCPMDPFIEIRSETDLDPKCGMAKATRHKYWESMPEDLRTTLPFQGYFRSELNRIMAARKRWNSLNEEAREKLGRMGRERLEKSRRKVR